ncbi:hypothetical protein ABIE67_007845 [Streptomyces sp. V4I8]
MDQPFLFPLADLKTEGYSQPEPTNEVVEETDETVEDVA